MPDLALLIAQMFVILATARIFGLVFRKIAQPQVVGEMVAGIALGPSLLGWVFPQASASLFPKESLGPLNALAELGLLLFMFTVGLELDLGLLRRRGRTAAVVSQASIVVPFALGATLALYLYPRLAAPGTPVFVFAAFLGTAMSITAFPVLARILDERGLLKTPLGSVAISCAAVGDVTGWLLLAAIVLVARVPSWGLSLPAVLLGTALYVAVMVGLVRPLLRRLEKRLGARGMNRGALAGVLLAVLASSWATQRIGLHAVFGAFFLGALMPRHETILKTLHERLSDVTVTLLVPLFFAFSGLRSSIALLGGVEGWAVCAVLVAVAIVGKLGGSAAAARMTGMTWRDATALGILLNTRGLMELVLLNIGLDIGLVTQATFTMLVLMALLTTFMTSPMLEWVYFRGSAVGEGSEA